MGLERVWFAQVELDRTRDRIKDIVLYQPGSLTDDVGFDRDPLEIAAEDRAGRGDVVNDLNDQAVAAGDVPPATPPADAQKDPTARPTLYVITRKSVLQSIDAETGRTNWVRVVGKSNRPSEAPAVNSKGIAIVNGSELYLINRENGETLWVKRLDVAPVSAVAMSENWIYVPSSDGIMSAYNIADPNHSWKFVAGTAINVVPVVTRDTLAFVTDYGRMFMAEKHTAKITRRFDANRSFSAPPTYWPPYIYAASMDGYMHAVHERSGVAIWRFSSGSPIMHAPVANENGVFVVTALGGLYCLSQDGSDKWFTPGITQLLASAPGRVYAVDNLQRLVAIDQATGKPLAAISILDQKYRLTNMFNDRMYVATPEGLIQCLRDITQEEPIIHVPPKGEDSPPAAGDAGGIDGGAVDGE